MPLDHLDSAVAQRKRWMAIQNGRLSNLGPHLITLPHTPSKDGINPIQQSLYNHHDVRVNEQKLRGSMGAMKTQAAPSASCSWLSLRRPSDTRNTPENQLFAFTRGNTI